ncbi:hypothetical protein [Rhizobium rhizogenes]|uniref:hypothetical protein n=1 Tax=Rhizobium rhizogenes TaxID=359 RepID=UPI0005A2C126
MMDLEVDLTYFTLPRYPENGLKARFSVHFPQINLEIRGWELFERDGRLLIDTPAAKTAPSSTVKAVVLRNGELRDYVRNEAIALYERESANARPY